MNTPGFVVLPEFLSGEQEDLLASRVRARQLLGEGDTLNGRYTARYGYDYAPKPCYLGPVPEEFVLANVFASFDALSINIYRPGAVLSPHIDNMAFGDTILILSLLGGCTMRLLPPAGTPVCVPIPRRSLTVLGGEVRRTWLHGIEGAEQRISLVFRKLRGRPVPQQAAR